MLTETLPAIPTSDADAAARTEHTTTTPPPAAAKTTEAAGEKPQILEDVVIEEVSIDGMCGVY